MEICSQRTYWASVALNLLIREIVSNTDDLTTTEFPDFWDPTFIRQLMLGTQGAIKKIKCIQDLHIKYPELLSHSERHLGDRNIYSSAAIKFATNVKNHLRMNLDRAIKTYVYKASGFNKEEGRNVLIDFFKYKNATKTELSLDRQLEVEKCVCKLQKTLGLDKESRISKMWMKRDENLPWMLKMFITTNRALEILNKPLINILPINRVKSHFITIDTSTMTGILQEIGLINDKNVLQEDLWKSILNVGKLQGKNKKFTGTIDSDGVVVNVHFLRPKNTKDAKEEIDLTDKRVLGIDPGRSNIFTVAEVGKSKDESIIKYRLTRQQYYGESGMTKARNKTNRWNSDVKHELQELSKNSSKSTRLEKFNDYIKASKKVNKRLFKEYMKKRWRAQRFRLYGGKKRTFARFLNKLGDPKETVIAFGSAKFAPCAPGEMAVPTSRAFKECSTRFKVVLVDEFRTSKINYKDDTLLDTVMSKGKQVRGLLWCRSSESTSQNKGKFVDRDLNAALNIRRCVVNCRPLVLQRRAENKPLNQQIGRFI